MAGSKSGQITGSIPCSVAGTMACLATTACPATFLLLVLLLVQQLVLLLVHLLAQLELSASKSS